MGYGCRKSNTGGDRCDFYVLFPNHFQPLQEQLMTKQEENLSGFELPSETDEKQPSRLERAAFREPRKPRKPKKAKELREPRDEERCNGFQSTIEYEISDAAQQDPKQGKTPDVNDPKEDPDGSQQAMKPTKTPGDSQLAIKPGQTPGSSQLLAKPDQTPDDAQPAVKTFLCEAKYDESEPADDQVHSMQEDGDENNHHHSTSTHGKHSAEFRPHRMLMML